MRKLLSLFILLALSATMCINAGVKLSAVLLDAQDNPVGVGNTAPAFSWQIQSKSNDVVQTAYQIVVATSKAGLNGNSGMVWNSGKVVSDKSVNIIYKGAKLQSATKYYWKVNVWTNKGDAKSAVKTFTTTLLNPSEWTAKWIGIDGKFNTDDQKRTILPARYLRNEFSVGGKVTRATLYIAGAGSTYAYINGKKVSNDVFGSLPSWFPTAINFTTYDVTPLITKGNNAIGILLGNGRYLSMRHDATMFGMPRVIAQLVIETPAGKTTVVTDGSWKATDQGPIRENNEYDGEKYDARMELGNWAAAGYDASAWKNADEMKNPTELLRPQMSPSLCINEQFKGKTVKKVGDDRYIIDMGQNFVGWTRVSFNGKKGQTIKLRFSETLQNNDTELYVANLRSALAEDHYTPATDGPFTWEPQLTYHGGRYIEVSGLGYEPSINDFTACVIYDKMNTAGTFESSSQLLNQIYKNAYWGIRGNYRGMPTDCPQRDERLGWLGDRATGCYSESLVFNNNLFYNKWLLDIEESMSPEGAISDVSPRYWTLWRPNVTWPSAYFYAADMVYQRFGNDYSIRNRYDSMRKYILFVKNKFYDNGIVTSDTYGDWCMPPEKKELIHSQDPARRTDGRILSTTVYYDLLRLMEKFARHNGRMADVAEYEAMRTQIREAYNNTFLDKTKGCYGNNTVTANILSLQLGLVPDAYRQQVIDNIVAVTNGPMFNGHISTGVLGVQHLMRGLTRNGHGDLALKIATNDTYPSWGYMVKHGATTFWELWNGDTADPTMNSGNHVMLIGDFVVWMYEDLAGIRNDVEEDSYGYKKILMQPAFIDGLDHAAATYASPYGPIASNWTRTGDNLTWNITVPANATAKVVVPAKFHIAPKEGNGVRTVSSDAGNTVIELGSGDYKFVSAK